MSPDARLEDGGDAPTTAAARQLGADAFVFGFPLLLTMATMRQATNVLAPDDGRAPLNRFAHLDRFSDPGFMAIVATNAHTLYSLAWLDLSSEPLILNLPDSDGRSYLMQLVGAWTNPLVSLGPRTAGTAGGIYALVGPGWSGSLPDGAHRVDAPTNTIWLICHIHATGLDDLDAGRAVQQDLALTPLSAYGTPHAPLDGVIDPGFESKFSPHRLLMKMGAEEFLVSLATEMGDNPPRRGDLSLLGRLETISLRPGEPFAWTNLSRKVQEALEAGLVDGRETVSASPRQRVENGWQTLCQEEEEEEEEEDLRLAQTANCALGTVHLADASFPLTVTDSDGHGINGGRRYLLRFEVGELPPVGALWSLCLYDMDQLFVDNPIDRYALGDRDELELGEDGSLEITIQHDRPNGSETNWLPAPEGDFNLMLHMYWPSQRVLDGGWVVPAVQRIG